jgi:hypothetical protein
MIIDGKQVAADLRKILAIEVAELKKIRVLYLV